MLIVIKELPRLNNNERCLLCRCDCGKLIRKRYTNMFRSSASKKTSCGCLQKEKKHKTKTTRHYRRLYHIWHSMVDRCTRKTSADYPQYGGRGITVASSWLDFANFYNDMIDTYTPGYSIERVDNDEGYSNDNCVWIVLGHQARNRRSSIIIDGMCAKEWCKREGIRYDHFLLNKRRYLDDLAC